MSPDVEPFREDVHPVLALDAASRAAAAKVLEAVSSAVSAATGWSEDDDGLFGQVSTEAEGRTVDVRFAGEGVASSVRIVVGSSAPAPVGGHWTATLDVTGMSPRIAALPRFERVPRLVALSIRILDASASDLALMPACVSVDSAWDVGRRHAQGLAAEYGASLDGPAPPLVEAWVRHPYAGAPGIVRMNGPKGPMGEARTCDVDLPPLASLVCTGAPRDGTVIVSGATRTAGVRAATGDPMTAMRLLRELHEMRARSGPRSEERSGSR